MTLEMWGRQLIGEVFLEMQSWQACCNLLRRDEAMNQFEEDSMDFKEVWKGKSIALHEE